MRTALIGLVICIALAGCLSPTAPERRDNGTINDTSDGGGPGAAVPAAPNPVCAVEATVHWTNTTTVDTTAPDEDGGEMTVERVRLTVDAVEIADVEYNRLEGFTDPSECAVERGEG